MKKIKCNECGATCDAPNEYNDTTDDFPLGFHNLGCNAGKYSAKGGEISVDQSLKFHDIGCVKRYGAKCSTPCYCELMRDNEKLKDMVAKYVDIAAVGQLTLLESISTNVISPR